MADYKLGYTYNKSISYNISFTYYSSSYQPSVSGPTTVKTDDSYSVTSSSRVNYTFTNIQKESYYYIADVRIQSTR